MAGGEQIGELARGAAWGRYVILDRLGEGSMGVVYAAYDSRLDRRVALKFLHPESLRTATPESRARLLREAQAMARLSHPNVIAVYDVGEIAGDVHLAMEFVEGRTLRKWLDERPRSWREVVKALSDAGQGLAAAHAAGVVHRDFKPDNVLVDKNGRVRVTDFGLARPDRIAAPRPPPDEPSASQDTLTRTGALLGTPAYMAPEQLDGRPVDHRTDQFCFCVALYEALYGERPFVGETVATLAFAKAMGKIRSAPREARVPPWLRRALLRGLSADPAKRYPSMEGLLSALGRDPARGRKRWAAAAIMGMLVVGGVAGVRARSAQLCRAGPEKFAGVWDESRRREVQKAFLGSDLWYAEDAWKGARDALDAYVSSWLEMYRDSCEATHRRGEQSSTLLDVRMACLERRRQEVRALADLFSAADEKMVENAVQAAHSQTPLATCADVQALMARAKRSQQPEKRTAVEGIEVNLSRVKALTDAGKYKEAVPLASQAVEAARATGDAFLVADALLALGTPTWRLGQYKHAETLLDDTIESALASNNDETFAKASVALMAIFGQHEQRPEEAHRWSRYARAVIGELGPGHDSIEASRLCNESIVYRDEGKYQDAAQLAEQCLALSKKVLAPNDPAMTTAINATAIVQYSLGHYRRAAEQWHQGATTLEAALGGHHPGVAIMLANEGFTLAEIRDPESLRILRRSRDMMMQLGLDSSVVAKADGNLGMAMIQLGRFDEGRALFEHALASFDRTVGRATWSYVWALYWIGEAYLRSGDSRDALRYAHRSWTQAEKLLGTKHPDLAYPLLTQGEAYLARGAISRAIPLLERSLALREASTVALDRKARSAFALARAIGRTSGHRGRALELARRARDLYREQGTGFENELSEVERWLARRHAVALQER